MATIEESVDVRVPVRVAYDRWTQFEEFPQFMSGVVEVRQMDDRHVHWVAEIGGERREWDAEIVEQQPDRVIAWRSVDGERNNGRVEFEPTADGTRITVAMEYDPESLKEQVGAVFGSDGRQVAEDLDRFRDLVETQGTAGDGWRGEIREGRVVAEDRGR